MNVVLFMTFLFITNELVLVSSELVYSELPSRITALSGSCLQIPCRFDGSVINLTNIESIFAVWIMKDNPFSSPGSLVVFNGSSNIIKGFSRIEILGNLSQRECTTVFYDVMNNHSDKYYFRVETNRLDRKYTYQNPIYISVSDSPQPLILKPTDLKEVTENTTVNLSCSAEAPCPKQPPTISWTYIPESTNITTQLQEKPDKTQSVFSHMTFKASYMDHRRNISCTVTYPRNTSNDSTVEAIVMLRVLFPPKESHITINPSASVSVGTNVTLTCKSKANPSKNMNYTWYKRGQQNQLDFGEQLIFTVNRRSGGWYFCIAKNKHGIQKSEEIQLIVAVELSVPLIAGCVGGISALLLLFLLAILLKRVQKAKASSESIVRETDQRRVQVDCIYENDFMKREYGEMPKQESHDPYKVIDFFTNCTI